MQRTETEKVCPQPSSPTASFTTSFCQGSLFTRSLCLLQQGLSCQWMAKFLRLQVTMKVWNPHRSPKGGQCPPQPYSAQGEMAQSTWGAVSTALRASVQPLITRNPAWLVRSWKKLILHWNNILYYLSHYCTTWRLGLFLIPQWRKIICWMFRGTGLYAQSCTG